MNMLNAESHLLARTSVLQSIVLNACFNSPLFRCLFNVYSVQQGLAGRATKHL